MPDLAALIAWARSRTVRDEHGMATAEALAYVALSVAMLVVLFGALQTLGLDTIGYIRRQIGV